MVTLDLCKHFNCHQLEEIKGHSGGDNCIHKLGVMPSNVLVHSPFYPNLSLHHYGLASNWLTSADILFPAVMRGASMAPAAMVQKHVAMFTYGSAFVVLENTVDLNSQFRSGNAIFGFGCSFCNKKNLKERVIGDLECMHFFIFLKLGLFIGLSYEFWLD